MNLPEAILLDLDDTILDDSGCVESCWTDACREAARLLPVLDPTVLQEQIRDYAGWWWSDASRHRRGRLDLRAATSEIVEEAFRRLGHNGVGVPAAIANLYRDLREERAQSA